MKAFGFKQAGPIERTDAIVELDVPEPQLRPQDILVRIEAVSVNPVDVKVRGFSQPQGPHRIVGFDAAGVVEAVGPAVTRFKVGDDVYYAGALDRPGSNQQLHAVDERLVGFKPKSLDFAAAAALPLTTLTAWELLFERLQVPQGQGAAGEAILIINGAGGVGSTLTQLADKLTGLTVIATASRPETTDWVRQMGADYVIDHRHKLTDGLKEIGIPEVRYVAGLTATDRHRDEIVAALKPHGALALIDDPEVFDIEPFKRKSLSVHWELMFTRSLFGTPDMQRQGEILNAVAGLIDNGVLRTTLHEQFSPIDAETLKKAHALVESGRSIGKVVISGL